MYHVLCKNGEKIRLYIVTWCMHKEMVKVYNKEQMMVTCVCDNRDKRRKEVYIWGSVGTRDLKSIPFYVL